MDTNDINQNTPQNVPPPVPPLPSDDDIDVDGLINNLVNSAKNMDVQDSTFAQTDIFTLMGAKDISDEDKTKMLEQMQSIVIKDFFANDLKSHLSQSQLQELEQKIANNTPLEEMMQDLQTILPDIDVLLFKKSLDFKKAFTLNHLKQQLEISKKKQQMIRNGEFPEDKTENGNTNQELLKLKNSDIKIETALKYYEQGKWVEGIRIING